MAQTHRFADYTVGSIRNTEMAKIRFLIVFWEGKSRGTKSIIELAKKKGIKIAIVLFNRTPTEA